MIKKKYIYLIDDHDMILAGLQTMLTGVVSLPILAFTSPKDALLSLKSKAGELIILDLSMDEMHGYKFIEESRKIGKNKIIVFTSHGEVWNVGKLLNFNINGIVHKNDLMDEIEYAVHEVLEGNNYYSPLIENTIKLLNKENINHLATRETEILTLSAVGFVAKEIATKLEISPNTVSTTHKKICSKLEALNITHAVKIAKDRGYI
ncbi:MAG: response regulator transcription factor [Salinivirgaceae bacterium]|nr:response regulator transcription factor [Salinivirgaceae bacterium]